VGLTRFDDVVKILRVGRLQARRWKLGTHLRRMFARTMWRAF
jgi:hypothetical protein